MMKIPKYKVTITMTLEFRTETTKKEVEDGVLAAMWGTKMSVQEGAWIDDFEVEAKEMGTTVIPVANHKKEYIYLYVKPSEGADLEFVGCILMKHNHRIDLQHVIDVQEEDAIPKLYMSTKPPMEIV